MKIANPNNHYTDKVINMLEYIMESTEDYDIEDFDCEFQGFEGTNPVDGFHNLVDELYENSGVEEVIRVHEEISENLIELRKRSVSLRDEIYNSIYVMTGREKQSAGNVFTIRDGSLYHYNSSEKLNFYELVGNEDIKNLFLDMCEDDYKEDMEKLFGVLENYDALSLFVYLEFDDLEISCLKEVEKAYENTRFFTGVSEYSNNYIVYKNNTKMYDSDGYVSPHSPTLRYGYLNGYESEESAVERHNDRTSYKNFVYHSKFRDEKYDIEDIERNICLSRDLLEVVYTMRDISEELLSKFSELEKSSIEEIEEIAVAANI